MARIVELAGLPGSGKTAVASLLPTSLASTARSSVRRHVGRVRKFRIDKLFLPLTVIRFGKVFRRLHSRVDPRTNLPYFLWSGRLILRAAAGFRTGANSYSSPAESILTLLNELSVEHWLASIESSMFGKNVVLDEGYVQRGIGAWLRSPVNMRAELWDAYVSCIPRKTTCVVLDCEPSEALRRAETRPRGLRAVTRWMPDGDANPSELNSQYREMAHLLLGHLLMDRATVIRADAGRPIAEVVEDIAKTLEPLDERNQWVVSTRN